MKETGCLLNYCMTLVKTKRVVKQVMCTEYWHSNVGNFYKRLELQNLVARVYLMFLKFVFRV